MHALCNNEAAPLHALLKSFPPYGVQEKKIPKALFRATLQVMTRGGEA